MERVGDDLPEDLGREAPQRREAAARAAASVGLVLWREHGSELVEVVALVVRPALFEDIIRVEKKFYGDWSKETRQLLADGDALAAYKRRAFDLYRQRFAPEALLRRVDAWNERGAPDDWQDS